MGAGQVDGYRSSLSLTTYLWRSNMAITMNSTLVEDLIDDVYNPMSVLRLNLMEKIDWAEDPVGSAKVKSALNLLDEAEAAAQAGRLDWTSFKEREDEEDDTKYEVRDAYLLWMMDQS